MSRWSMSGLVESDADMCRARCGGTLIGIDVHNVSDGSGYECGRCRRWHEFTVTEAGRLRVSVGRKPRAKAIRKAVRS